MFPVEEAKKVYSLEPCARSFDQDLLLHFLHGYVFSTPRVFLMARVVDRHEPYELITNPEHQADAPNAWLVYLAAGNLKEFFKFEPYPMPYFGFERGNRLRFYPRERIKQLCILMPKLPKTR